MRIFCDTNVIVELLEDRFQADEVQRILANGKHEFYMSAGCFFTLTYLLERHFKQQGIHQPELDDLCRRTLKGVLRIFEVSNIDRLGFEACLDDHSIKDLEDGCQYQAALACGADILLTLNYKDFKDANQSMMKIMTPSEYLSDLG